MSDSGGQHMYVLKDAWLMFTTGTFFDILFYKFKATFLGTNILFCSCLFIND